jgi:hypothetical protein
MKQKRKLEFLMFLNICFLNDEKNEKHLKKLLLLWIEYELFIMLEHEKTQQVFI